MFAIPACPDFVLLHLRARRLRPKFQEMTAIAPARRHHVVVAIRLHTVAITIVGILLHHAITALAVTLGIVVDPHIPVTTTTIATMAVAIDHHLVAMLVDLQSATPIQSPATMSVILMLLLRYVIAMTMLHILRTFINDVGLR